jgi:hypothetical protein
MCIGSLQCTSDMQCYHGGMLHTRNGWMPIARPPQIALFFGVCIVVVSACSSYVGTATPSNDAGVDASGSTSSSGTLLVDASSSTGGPSSTSSSGTSGTTNTSTSSGGTSSSSSSGASSSGGAQPCDPKSLGEACRAKGQCAGEADLGCGMKGVCTPSAAGCADGEICGTTGSTGDGTCCRPATMTAACAANVCGSAGDGCGRMVSCGDCPAGLACMDGKCCNAQGVCVDL